MVNTNELKAAIVMNGYSQAEVAHKLNITPRSFYSKMKKHVFNSDEIEQLVVMLNIENPVPIFFDSLVS